MCGKISIIVPIFNAEKTLSRCIESLIHQTYRNLEIILVDDDSKDNSLVICKKYQLQDKRIKVLHKHNGGVSSARNAGLDIASGEFVMFCDSDDWVDSEWCETLFMEYKPDHLVMCGQYVEGKQEYFPYRVCTNNIVERNEFLRLKMKMFNVPWNKIFKKSIIDKYNLRYDTRLTNGEDLLFNVLYMVHISGNIVCINKCLYHYTWPNDFSLSKYIPADYIEQRNYFMEQIEIAINKIGDIGNENKVQLYTDLFNEYLKILFSIFADSSKSFSQKIKIGNRLIQSKEYKKCIRKISDTLSDKQKRLYKVNHCYSLFFWYSVKKIWKGKG